MANPNRTTRPSLPYGPDVRTVTPSKPAPPAPRPDPTIGWDPGLLSLIRHIAQETHGVQVADASASMFTEAHNLVKRQVAIASAKLKLTIYVLAASLVSILGAIAIAWLTQKARALEQDPEPLPITIPVVAPAPNAEQVESQGADLQQLRRDLDTLLALERARAEREAEAAKVKRRAR